VGAELWFAAQPIAGALVEIYPRRGISLIPDPDVLDDTHCRVARSAGGSSGPPERHPAYFLKGRDPGPGTVRNKAADQRQRGTIGCGPIQSASLP